MGGHVQNTIQSELPSVLDYLKTNGNRIANFTPPSGQTYKLEEGDPIPADLQQTINSLGRSFIDLMQRQGADLPKTREFAGTDITNSDGTLDPKKVGTILFAAASTQDLHVNRQPRAGIVVFDNVLTVQDLNRLTRSEEDRATILEVAQNARTGILSIRVPDMPAHSILQECAQALCNSGVTGGNLGTPPRPSAPTFGGQIGGDGPVAKC